MSKRPEIPYVAPFAAFMLFLMVGRWLPWGPEVLYPLRLLTVGALLLTVSRPVLSFRVARPMGSVLLGMAVFAIWVLPDQLWPGYRHHWLFENSLMGKVEGSVPPHAEQQALFLFFRILGATLAVPILEELFWRGWLMRWLINKDFLAVPLGAYARDAFWLVAVLFASEHGPYWDVGLAAGVAYNWWMVRTRTLGDCILAHAVTNGCLSAFVLATHQWQYWM